MLCALAWGGCGGDSSQPQGDDDDTGSAGCWCADPASAATFTQVYEMLFPRTTNAHCDMCHGLPPYDISNGNLSTGMDKASTYAALVGKMSTPASVRVAPLVVPGQPEESMLLQKLSDPPPCGDRMPVGGMALSQEQIEMIRSWIAAGASDELGWGAMTKPGSRTARC